MSIDTNPETTAVVTAAEAKPAIAIAGSAPEGTAAVAKASSETSSTAPASLAIPEPASAAAHMGSPGIDPRQLPPHYPRRLRELRELEQQHMRGWPAANPRIGEHDLRLAGELKVVSAGGIILNIPISTTMPGALSPGFLPLAQQQFEMLLDQLLVKPTVVSFNAHIESVIAARKAEAVVKRSSDIYMDKGLFRLPPSPNQSPNPEAI